MFDAKDPNSKFPPIEPLRPPKGAPNVLLVLLDDAGFAAMSRFGGPCNTPTAERLAAITTQSAWAISPKLRRPLRE
jgi:arylsulfatase